MRTTNVLSGDLGRGPALLPEISSVKLNAASAIFAQAFCDHTDSFPATPASSGVTFTANTNATSAKMPMAKSNVIGTPRCGVRAAFSGAASVVERHVAHVPPALRRR